MANLRPRPTLDQVSHWQGEARSRLGETGPDAPEWRTVASFVVVFSQRQVDGHRERRVEAEQTEVEPERDPQVWFGWDCEPVCEWMRGQVSQVDSTAGRPQLQIDSAAVIDAAGQAGCRSIRVVIVRRAMPLRLCQRHQYSVACGCHLMG